jgi:opacity protein-like surface antigen
MKSKILGFLLSAVMAVVVASPAGAQYGQQPRKQSQSWGTQQQQHRIEILGYGGYMWTGSLDAWYGSYSGELDVKDSGFWGIEADINVRPGAQLVLGYSRQDSKMTFGYNSAKLAEGDVAIEYWQIGGMSGVQKGKVMPFGMFTLGGTRVIPNWGGADSDDVWKFSIVFGLGAKIYLNEKIGLRIQGRMPWTIVDGGAYMGCGGGGCYTSFGGSGIIQGDVSGGLFVMF